MNHLSKFAIAIALLTLTGTSWAGDACDETKSLRNEGISYDISARRKRVTLRQALIDLRTQDNETEKKIADTEEQILKTNGESLWNEYDVLNQKRDEINKKMSQTHDEYMQISRERMAKKIDYKYRRLQKWCECLLNEPLTDRLNNISNRLNKKFNKDDIENFIDLVQQRLAMADNLKHDFENYKKTIAEQQKKLNSLNQQLAVYTSKEKEYDAESDKQYELIHEEFDKLSNNLDSYSHGINNLSGQLLVYIDRFK